MAPTTPREPVTDTATVLTTVISTVDVSVLTSYTTITQAYETTISATRGQTIVINNPSQSTLPTPITTDSPVQPALPTFIPTVPTTKVSLVPVADSPTTTFTTTLTEIDVYLQTAGQVYSTWNIPFAPTPPDSSFAPIATTNNGDLVYVVAPNSTCNDNDDWNCWSDGAKAGLVIGVVAAAALLVWGLVWLFKKDNQWIAHDWRWARGVEQQNVVPTVNVPGYLDPRMATPYGYGVGQGVVAPYSPGNHPGWGYVR